MGSLLGEIGAGQDLYVASLADNYGVKGKVAKAPISTHPAFPFIVALWFAALLGMGSLVVPVELIEQIAVSTGIATVVPATAPPLGFTARSLIALCFTGAGALAGLLIARRIGKLHTPETGRRYPAGADRNGARSPISAHAELGSEGLDGHRGSRRPAIQPKGRRSLAIDNDHGPSELLDFAPLPGKRMDQNVSSLELLDLNAREIAPEAWGAHTFDEDELELTEDDLVAEGPFSRSLPQNQYAGAQFAEAVPGFQTFADDGGDATMDDRPPFSMPVGNLSTSTARPLPERQEFRAPPAAVFEPTWSDEDELPAPEPVAETFPAADAEPLSFSPPSMARFEAPAAMDFATSEEIEDTAPMFENHEQFAGPVADGPEPVNSALDDLGLVQLAQRLGNSIERRRDLQAARALLTPKSAPVASLAEDLEAAAPAEAAEAMAAYFASPVAPAPAEAFEAGPFDAEPTFDDEPEEAELVAERQMFRPVADTSFTPAPVAYRPLEGFAQFDPAGDDGEEDDDGDIADLAASFSLPLNRQPAAPPAFAAPQFAPQFPAPTEPHPTAQAELEDEKDYGSLLALRNPFHERTEVFVRIEDEPEAGDAIGQSAVVFPAEAPMPVPSPTAGSVPTQWASQPAAPVDSEENERALREALLNLQRMSGAA